MTWQEAAATVVVLLGLGAGAFLVAQRPAFWIAFGTRLLAALVPFAVPYLQKLFKRMDPETESRWRHCQRSGGKWNPRTRKCE